MTWKVYVRMVERPWGPKPENFNTEAEAEGHADNYRKQAGAGVEYRAAHVDNPPRDP